MPLNIVPAISQTSLNSAGMNVAKKIYQIYKEESETSWLYIDLRMNIQPNEENYEPNFVLIDPQRGVCVIEAFGANKNSIINVTRAEFTTKKGGKKILV